jgi:hypothetical protein
LSATSNGYAIDMGYHPGEQALLAIYVYDHLTAARAGRGLGGDEPAVRRGPM